MPQPAALYNRRKWQLIGKSQWCCSANCGHPLHALTYSWTRDMQLANTPPPQSTTPSLHPVSFHQMAPPVRGNTHPITAYYSVYRPRKDERLSRPAWLVTYRNIVANAFVHHVCCAGTFALGSGWTMCYGLSHRYVTMRGHMYPQKCPFPWGTCILLL